MANYSSFIKQVPEKPFEQLIPAMEHFRSNTPDFSNYEPDFGEMGDVTAILHSVAKYAEMQFKDSIDMAMNRHSPEPRWITNFHADELHLHIKAIEECGHPGLYIKKDAYSSTGFKLPDYFALMLVDSYDMAKFWHVVNELRAKYPVRPKVSLQEAMLGTPVEHLRRIDELCAIAEAYAAAYGKMPS